MFSRIAPNWKAPKTPGSFPADQLFTLASHACLVPTEDAISDATLDVLGPMNLAQSG